MRKALIPIVILIIGIVGYALFSGFSSKRTASNQTNSSLKKSSGTIENESAMSQLENSSSIPPATKKRESKNSSTNNTYEDAMGYGRVSKQIIEAELLKRLERSARAELTYRKTSGNWMVVCGRPVETDGSDFDYKRSTLATEAEAGLIDDKFCALLQKSDENILLREFDLGGTDSPIIDWIAKYELPNDVLK